VTYAGVAVVAGEDRYLRRCGYVLQGYGLVSVLTGSENVELPLQLRGHDADAVKLAGRRALQRVSLPEVLDRLVEDLSGGSSSGSRWRERWPAGRSSSSPTSRPQSWTR
jgi:ABC-type multidrug transport system ATPase subunit